MAIPNLFSGLWGGGGGAAGSVGGATPAGAGQLISPTGDPTFARLLEAAQAAIPQSQPSVMDIAGQGASSPLLSAILGPMLERLKQPQAAQRTQLTEATRATGGLRDSAYTGGMNELLQKQGLQQNDLMAQILQQTLGPLLQASMQQQAQSYNPANILGDLLGAARPQYVPPQGGGGSAAGGIDMSGLSPSLGLATPMAGDTMASTAGPGQWGYVNGRLQQIPYPDAGGGGGYNPPAAAAPSGGGYDPLTQYLLGGQGSTFPIEQSGANSWQSVSYNPLTDYAQTNMEY